MADIEAKLLLLLADADQYSFSNTVMGIGIIKGCHSE